VAETCDALIQLPNRGTVGSLNVATAASAIVYGILHFRGETLDRAP
jgi:tRNA G18 (ribose-2'-O)-methylase SpoU